MMTEHNRFYNQMMNECDEEEEDSITIAGLSSETSLSTILPYSLEQQQQQQLPSSNMNLRRYHSNVGGSFICLHQVTSTDILSQCDLSKPLIMQESLESLLEEGLRRENLTASDQQQQQSVRFMDITTISDQQQYPLDLFSDRSDPSSEQTEQQQPQPPPELGTLEQQQQLSSPFVFQSDDHQPFNMTSSSSSSSSSSTQNLDLKFHVFDPHAKKATRRRRQS